MVVNPHRGLKMRWERNNLWMKFKTVPRISQLHLIDNTERDREKSVKSKEQAGSCPRDWQIRWNWSEGERIVAINSNEWAKE